MRLLAATLTGLVVLLLAPPAFATTVVVDGGRLTVTGGGGAANRIAITTEADRIRVRDVNRVRAGNGCVADGSRSATCRAGLLTNYVVVLGDRSDRLDVARTLTIRGRISGGSGDDTLVGGGGPDRLDGGDGRDTVSYANRADPVRVNLEGSVPDGAPGEGDDIRRTERIIGTTAGDDITGREAAESLQGGNGNDRLVGGPGNDSLYGGRGDDIVAGGNGNDRLFASASLDGRDVFSGRSGIDTVDYSSRRAGVVADADGIADDGQRAGGTLSLTGPIPVIARTRSTEGDNLLPDVERIAGGRGDDVLGARRLSASVLSGGGGTDVLVGGQAADRFAGGSGFDRILARDGKRDQIGCGTQTDRVFGDDDDDPAADCETTRETVGLSVRPARRSLDGTLLPATLTCPAYAGTRCVGAVTLRTLRPVRTLAGSTRIVSLGSVQFNVPAGTTRRVRVRTSPTGRSTLARQGSATSVQLAARGRDMAGAARTSTARFILRR